MTKMKNSICVLNINKTILLAFSVFILFSCGKNESACPKVAFIESARVFDEFEMKKEYDKLLENELAPETNLLDSLDQLAERYKQDSVSLLRIRRDYYLTQQQYDAKFNNLSADYTAKVYEKLNASIEEYGKAKNYNIIFGSSGGNVMFVSDDDNITTEVIAFINKEYKK